MLENNYHSLILQILDPATIQYIPKNGYVDFSIDKRYCKSCRIRKKTEQKNNTI